MESEYRPLKREGKCSICYSGVDKDGEKVAVCNSIKHRRLIVICNDCVDDINNLREEDRN